MKSIYVTESGLAVVPFSTPSLIPPPRGERYSGRAHIAHARERK